VAPSVQRRKVWLTPTTRGRHLHSAGRPLRWASAHVLVIINYYYCICMRQTPLSRSLNLKMSFTYCHTSRELRDSSNLRCFPMPSSVSVPLLTVVVCTLVLIQCGGHRTPVCVPCVNELWLCVRSTGHSRVSPMSSTTSSLKPGSRRGHCTWTWRRCSWKPRLP